MNKKPATSKSKKIRGAARWRKRAISIAVATFFILSIFIYFAHAIGLPAKILPAANIAGDSVKITEFSYYYNNLYATYVNYGILSGKADLDRVADAEGRTYREMFSESAAESWQEIILLERRARAEGFEAVSAKKTADDSISEIRAAADIYGITADQYLANTYGNGITVRVARSIVERQAYVSEYINYLLQGEYAVSSEEAATLFEEDPGAYAKITFHAYRIPALDPALDEEPEDAEDTSVEEDTEPTTTAPTEPTEAPEPTEGDIQVAVDRAQAIVDEAKDAEAFLEASKNAGVAADVSRFEDGNDPTLFTDYEKGTITSNFGEEVSDFLSAKERKEGDTTVVKTEVGAIAVFFQERTIDEQDAVTYRKITLAVDYSNEDMTAAAQMISFHQELENMMLQGMDEAAFASKAKESSDDSSAISGGLIKAAMESSFTLTEEHEHEEDEEVDHEHEETEPTHDDILFAWLFDEKRVKGNMTIVENTGSVSLYFFCEKLPAWQMSVQATAESTAYYDWYDALTKEEGNGYTIHYGFIEFAT